MHNLSFFLFHYEWFFFLFPFSCICALLLKINTTGVTTGGDFSSKTVHIMGFYVTLRYEFNLKLSWVSIKMCYVLQSDNLLENIMKKKAM